MILTDQEREIAWNRSAKGRGNRWRMLRDIMGLLCLQVMNLTEIQDAMMSLKGLSRQKVHTMLDELARAGYIKPTSWSIDGAVYQGWVAGKVGVFYWIGDPDTIPVSLARVVEIMKSARL